MSTSEPDQAQLGQAAADALAHGATYHRFMLGVKTVAMTLGLIATFLILWLATPAGLAGAVFVVALLAAAGLFAMTHGLANSSERKG